MSNTEVVEMEETSKGCIIIADDEADISNLVEMYLVKEGYSVFTARNGLDALNSIVEHKPNLVLLDIMMPEISGLEIAQLIRMNKDYDALCVVMFSANRKSEIWDSLDIDGYINKPFSRKEILEGVAAALIGRKEMLDLIAASFTTTTVARVDVSQESQDNV
jgi:DNA-binding response OmpR family regulator